MSYDLARGVVLAALIVLRTAARRRACPHRRYSASADASSPTTQPATHGPPAARARTDRSTGEHR